MKKYGFRVLVGLIAFTIGVNAAIWKLSQRIACDFVSIQNEQKEIYNPTYHTNPNGKIEVKFNGYKKSENRLTLIFELINHNTKPANYWSEHEKSNWTYIKFNGKEKEVRLCGTGIKKFELESGKSFTVEILPDNFFHEYLNKDGKIQFGYGFELKKDKVEKFWSEPITISEEMKQDFIQNAPEFLKENEGQFFNPHLGVVQSR